MSEAPLTPATDEELSGWVSCAMIAGDNGQDENASLTHRDVLRVMEAVHRDRAELSSLRELVGRAREALRPFGELGREIGNGAMESIVYPDDLRIEGVKAYNRGKDYFITVGDLRKASAVHASLSTAENAITPGA